MEFNEEHLEELDKTKKRVFDKTFYDDITKNGLQNIEDVLEDISPLMYNVLLEENEILKTQIEHKDKIINKLEELYLEQLKAHV